MAEATWHRTCGTLAPMHVARRRGWCCSVRAENEWIVAAADAAAEAFELARPRA
jgi:hypothetical protein